MRWLYFKTRETDLTYLFHAKDIYCKKRRLLLNAKLRKGLWKELMPALAREKRKIIKNISRFDVYLRSSEDNGWLIKQSS